MKIVCISKRNSVGITKGGLYDLIENESTENFFAIKNDFGNFCLYPKKLFKSLAVVRKNKIDSILLPIQFIFDTNAYRNLVHGLTLEEAIDLGKKLQSKEEALECSSAASIVVMMELIQHLVEGDPAQEDCYKALCMMFHHTSKVNFEEQMRTGNYYPPINIILAQVFFDNNSEYKKMYDRVVDIFIEVVKHADMENCKKLEEHIQAIKSQIVHEKNEFKINVENFLSSLNGGELDWQYINKNKSERDRFFNKINNGEMFRLLALSLMQRAYQVMEVRELTPDAELRFQKFTKEYKAAILMNITLLESIGHGVERLSDISDERWNTLNDVQIMFALLFVKNGFYDKILVTEEKKIKQSASNASIGESIISIDEYKRIIKFDD